MTCRYCGQALPLRPAGKSGPQPQICASTSCQLEAGREHSKRYYRRHRNEVLERNRAWQQNNRERCAAIRRRYFESHTPPSRSRPKQNLYMAAWKEAKRLGVNPGDHWFRWLSGSLEK